jgi:hypothetical protein
MPSCEWRDLADKTRTRDARLIEAFLAHGGDRPWGDGPVSELRHTNIEDYLETYLDVPHVERRALLAIRKLVQTAIRKDWIAADPTYAIKRNPAASGWPAWSRDMMDAYERRWPIGTPQRTAYALGLHGEDGDPRAGDPPAGPEGGALRRFVAPCDPHRLGAFLRACLVSTPLSGVDDEC